MSNQKKTPSFFLSCLVCAFASFFYFYVYIIHVMPSAMTQALMSAFSIQAAGLGILSSLYYYGYTPMQIPAGLLYDRFGARTLLTIILLLCAASTLAFGLTSTYHVALLARWVMGLTASFGFVGALVVGAAWFPARYFAAYTGMVQLLGCAGAILGQGPIALLTNSFGWRMTATLIAALGFIFAILIWIVIRDTPESSPNVRTKKIRTTESIPSSTVFKKMQNWWIALYGFGIWGPIVTFASLWGVPFFHDVYRISNIQAASLTSLVWVGIAVGGPILGWWSYRIARRIIPMSVSALIGVISATVLIYFPFIPMWIIALLLLGLGIAGSAQALCFGIINDINHKDVLGTAIGFTNMAIVTGGILLQPLAGIILQHISDGRMSNGIPIYSMHNYQIALITVPLCFLLSLLVSTFFIRETYCEHQIQHSD